MKLQDFKHKKHLFFDLDHTLWDFDKNSSFAFETIFKERGFAISLQDFLNIYIQQTGESRGRSAVVATTRRDGDDASSYSHSYRGV